MAVLNSLYDLYRSLRAAQKIAPYTWSSKPVNFAIDLNADGNVRSIIPLQQEKEVKRSFNIPVQFHRTSNIQANFLCDKSAYILGLDKKSNERTRECFESSKDLHHTVLESNHDAPSHAILNFYNRWDPNKDECRSALAPFYEEILDGGLLIFAYEGSIIDLSGNFEKIVEAWDNYYRQQVLAVDAKIGQCLVTGQETTIARLHPSFNVLHAQKSGASLVSFNSPAYESYGQTQGYNSPVSQEASLAYGAALKYLLTHQKLLIGDTTVVYWTRSNGFEGKDLRIDFPVKDEKIKETISNLKENLQSIVELKPIDSDITKGEIMYNPDDPFFILGIGPNASRLSIRFFLETKYGEILKNVQEHHERASIHKAFIENKKMDIHTLLKEMSDMRREKQNVGGENPRQRKNLSSSILMSIWTNTKYPSAMLHGVLRRIYAENGNISSNRAAIIKAYLMKNLPEQYKVQEVLTVQLNPSSDYEPYILGRLFAVLEKIQNDSVGSSQLNAGIKSRYFASACTSPSTIFPYLIKLSQNHLKKLENNKRIYHEKNLQELFGRLKNSFPKFLSLSDQGVMQIGYYHQNQQFYRGKAGNIDIDTHGTKED